MAKVEMSLSEYNEMKEELDFLRRVIKEVTSPKPSDWELEYARTSSSSINAELSDEVKDFLTQQIEENLPKSLIADDLKVEVQMGNPTLCRVEPKPEETKEIEEVPDNE